ncbi:hypothetical protein RND81_01G013100 [Saponaria officinalis]|uniref:M-phase phosphoprotein 6 n=1 Tax=Saponaria officinalis TaxID=3572 RepID=A0AAW1N842_SAPOF
MGKMEMSTVLKNLKFMQRAAQKEEKIKEEEQPKADGNFIPPSNVNRKCVVILEGDPQPGTVRGRMSFQNFNPTIDKLNEDEEANGREAEASTSALFQSGRSTTDRIDRKKKSSESTTSMDLGDNNGDGERKRKQPKDIAQTSNPKKQQKNSQGNKQHSSSVNGSSNTQPKRDKLDFNVLVPPKSQSKRKGR